MRALYRHSSSRSPSPATRQGARGLGIFEAKGKKFNTTTPWLGVVPKTRFVLHMVGGRGREVSGRRHRSTGPSHKWAGSGRREVIAERKW